jgi:DNA-binding NarL/FixJ family response regulator
MLTAANPIRIIIADDHYFFRTGFRNVMETKYAGQLQIISEVSDGIGLLEAIERLTPDVVITDIQMPNMNGIDACRRIKAAFPYTAVIAFSMFADTDNIIAMLQAGADGYLVKTCTHEEIIMAITTVHQRKHYYCTSIAEKMYGTLMNANQKKNKEILFGEQEKRVMELICLQKSSKEIAVEMKLATRTVENYKSNIQEKIGARNMVGIALYAVFNQMVQQQKIL